MATRPSAIDGVQIVRLSQFSDERGTVFHMLKSTDPHFQRFGEIYFSSVYRGVVKGWKRHRRMAVNYTCIFGRVKLVLFDDRDGSPTCGALMELVLSPEEYVLVVISPGIWHGFQGASHPAAIVANCATEASDPTELDRLDPRTAEIPYTWTSAR